MRARGKYLARAIQTGYWVPGEDYDRRIAEAVTGVIEDGDIVVVSEKAVSVAMGKMVDESTLNPGLSARLLAGLWTRFFWGYLLGPLCRLPAKSLHRLRTYPLDEGAAHKQAALIHVGPYHALRHGSEAGMDVSNLPYAYAALPLKDPAAAADRARARIKAATGKDVTVMVSDTDRTYSVLGLNLASRPTGVKGIVCLGLLAYVVGRLLRAKRRATPLATSPPMRSVEEALEVAELGHRARGHGAGATAWDMAERFGVGLTGVTWEMLGNIPHRPVVVVRRRSASGSVGDA